MSANKVEVWEDSQGGLHRSEADAIDADKVNAIHKQLNDVGSILQAASQRLGRKGLPHTVEQAAEVGIEAYGDLAVYFGKNPPLNTIKKV